MLQRLPRLAVVIALASSIGLHWAFFQSVAWMGMVISYSQQAGFQQALVKTFDGKHPCALCKEIARDKQSERKTTFPLELKKFEFLCVQARFVFTAPAEFWYLRGTEDCLRSVVQPPPTPPPRAGLV